MITKKEWLEQPGRLSRKMAYHTERLLSLRREADAVASRWGGERLRAMFGGPVCPHAGKDRNPAGETEMGE